MAKNDGPVMVRMINVNTGQPVQVAEEKVGRMTSDWVLDDGEKGTDPREAAKAGASKADKARAAARAKADKDAAKAEQAAAGDASAETATTGADGA